MLKLGELKLGTQIKIALLIFLLALVIANLLSTLAMLESRTELERQEKRNFADASLALAQTALRHNDDSLSKSLVEDMAVTQADAAVGLYDENGVRINVGSLSGDNLAISLLPQTAWRQNVSMPTASSIEAAIRTLHQSDHNYFVTEVPLIRRPSSGQSVNTKPAFYMIFVGIKSPRFTSQNYFVFAFQGASILLCLLFIHFFSHWLIYPYNQIEKMARASSLVMKGASKSTEQQGLIETFQTAINELRVKEQQLEKLNKLEQERAQGYERLSTRIVTSIPSGLIAVDINGRLIVANEQAYRILGVTPEADPSAEQSYRDLFKSCSTLVGFMKESLTTGRTFRRQEVVAEFEGKGRRMLEVSISPLGKGYQDIHGALCLLADITEINALRDQIRVRENLAPLGEMAAGIAHEFKNSLATIQGFAQLIESSGGEMSRHREVSSALIDETRHLTQMVSDFLRFARPEDIQACEVDLDELTRDCLEELDALRKETNVNVTTTGEFPVISGDQMMLRHAFLNLFRNAMEAMDERSTRELKIVAATTVDAFGQPCATIDISDTGCGIPQDLLAKVFIPFFSTKSRGSGIGLAIVQKVFAGHGGSIEIVSVEEVGTIFHCRLPIAKLADPKQQTPELKMADSTVSQPAV